MLKPYANQRELSFGREVLFVRCNIDLKRRIREYATRNKVSDNVAAVELIERSLRTAAAVEALNGAGLPSE